MMIKISQAACFTLFVLSLGGCDAIDYVGRQMPVIGERCENWQCFTSSGQAQSEANKREREAQEAREEALKNGASPDASTHIPLNGNNNPQGAAIPPAPAAAVPSVPVPSSPTPFDMPPEELERSSNPNPE